MSVLVYIAIPVTTTLAVAWLCRAGLVARHAVRALAGGGAAVQFGFCLVAWLLFALLPEEGNRHGGTCVSYRSGSLDEVILALGWFSALVGGLTLAASREAARRSGAGGWYAVALMAIVLPYTILIAYVWLGLCYALDT